MNYLTIDYLSHWGIQREERWANKKYLAFIASLKCIICGAEPHVSHTLAKSAGKRASDALCTPKCVDHHLGKQGIHGLGKEGFEQAYSINLNHAVIMCWTIFLNKHGRDITIELKDCTTRAMVLCKMESLINELA